MSVVWCGGAYESIEAKYFPFAAPPILLEQSSVGWRKLNYRLERPYRIIIKQNNGQFQALEELSVYRGDYIRFKPERFSPSQILVILGVQRHAFVRTRLECLRALLSSGGLVRGPIYWSNSIRLLQSVSIALSTRGRPGR